MVEMDNVPKKEFRVMIFKDDPRTWEKNRCTEQEVTSSF